MVGRRKLSDYWLNRSFNALLIGVQYTLSFQWTTFGLKCLILALVCNLIALILGWNCVKGLWTTNIVKQNEFEGV